MPPPPSYSPLPTSPQVFAHPRRAPSLARFSLTCSISAPPGKGKESAATQANRIYDKILDGDWFSARLFVT